MVTDDERREVAERLLDVADECDMMRDDGLPIGSYEIDRIARRTCEARGEAGR